MYVCVQGIKEQGHPLQYFSNTMVSRVLKLLSFQQLQQMANFCPLFLYFRQGNFLRKAELFTTHECYSFCTVRPHLIFFITFFLQGDQRTNINHIPDSEVTVVLVNHNQDGKENQFLALNDRTMIQWLNLVWFANVPSSSLLLADSFHTHTSSLTQKFMVSRGACLAIIPSACSHKLQPLNRGIKHKFKVRSSY